MFGIEKSSVPSYVIVNITDSLKCSDINDEDDWYDSLHEFIDYWVGGSTGEAKKIVDDFGVLKAIRLYWNSAGCDFELDDNDNKVYLELAYCIIKEWFNEHMDYDTFKTST